MDIEKIIKALERKLYNVSYFSSYKEAAEYIDRSLDGKVIGFGDSATLEKMDMYSRLSSHNIVYDPSRGQDNDEFLELARKTQTTEIYLTSVNAMTEKGEMVNIDGTGNRVAGSLFGHEKVYFVVSTNKIMPDLEQAVWRARNIASPKNSMRLGLDTPCVKMNGERCYDCRSQDRICNALVIYLRKMNDIEDVEVILIDEEMGF